MNLFKEYPANVLLLFLDWPWQDLSLNVAEIIWPHLTAIEYADLLWFIARKIERGYNLSKLFRVLFLHGSSDFRKHFVDDECQKGDSFYAFFKVQDSETIKIIFRAVDSEDKKKLICTNHVFKLFYKSILRGKGDMAKLCLQEASLKKEDKKELKQVFSTFLTEITEVERDGMLEELRVPFFNRAIMKWTGEIPAEVISDPILKFQTDIRITNRRKYVWEQFLLIVDEGNAKTLCKISLGEEDMEYPSTDSECEDLF